MLNKIKKAGAITVCRSFLVGLTGYNFVKFYINVLLFYMSGCDFGCGAHYLQTIVNGGRFALIFTVRVSETRLTGRHDCAALNSRASGSIQKNPPGHATARAL